MQCLPFLTGLKEIEIFLSADFVLGEVAAGCSAGLWMGRPIFFLLSPKGDVVLKVNDRELIVSPGSNLLMTLSGNGVFLPSACGGGAR